VQLARAGEPGEELAYGQVPQIVMRSCGAPSRGKNALPICEACIFDAIASQVRQACRASLMSRSRPIRFIWTSCALVTLAVLHQPLG
jgi:hypothetical protein